MTLGWHSREDDRRRMRAGEDPLSPDFGTKPMTPTADETAQLQGQNRDLREHVTRCEAAIDALCRAVEDTNPARGTTAWAALEGARGVLRASPR